MSNGKGRRRPSYIVWIPILAAIIGAIVVVILGDWIGPTDFNVSISPMGGEVQAGGVIQTTVNVEGIRGYKYPVSLTASDQPPGVVVTFAPPFGQAKPAYASSMTVNVGSNVQVGAYDIKVNGTGADGKEHFSKYKLTVMPSGQAASESRPSSPPSSPQTTPEKPLQTPLKIDITSLGTGDRVAVSTTVSGTFSGQLPKGQYMWVVINPHPSPGQWWPQGGRISPENGMLWDVDVWLGREKEDVGKKFDIAVILVNSADDKAYLQYLENGQETEKYPGIPLPDSARIIDRITVTRR